MKQAQQFNVQDYLQHYYGYKPKQTYTLKNLYGRLGQDFKPVTLGNYQFPLKAYRVI